MRSAFPSGVPAGLLAALVGAALLAGCSGGGKKKTVDLGNGVSMELVLIRPGSFRMGTTEEEYEALQARLAEYGAEVKSARVPDIFAAEMPAHTVTISRPFYLGRYEVTQEQWEAVLGKNPSPVRAPKDPVSMVSWEDCQEFVRKLSERTGGKFGLPTEAEWEYACRAGGSTRYGFGDDESSLGRYAWFGENSEGKAHPVGQKRPNAWGLCDLHGNVAEWCEDAYHRSHRGAPADGSAWVAGGRAGFRVQRGSCWYGLAEFCRSAARGAQPSGNRSPYGGLRVCMREF